MTVQDAEERNVEARLKREFAAHVREIKDTDYRKLPIEALREIVVLIRKASRVPQNREAKEG